MKRTILIISLFMLGISLIIYPYINDSLQERKQDKLLAEWDHFTGKEQQDLPIAAAANAPPATDRIQPKQQNYLVPALENEPELDAEDASESVSVKPSAVINGLTLTGSLHIESIDVSQPILEDATERSLDYGVGTVLPGIEAGDYGNYVLAGHRGRSYGRLLNRLDELEVGDEIVVEAVDKEYRYYVTESFLVEPDELWVLEQDDSVQELTLITCHPVRNPTHRLIIKASIS